MFYNRLDFYRMLEAGITNLDEVAVLYNTTVRTIQRWKKQDDPDRGPYGSLENVKNLDTSITLQFVSPENVRHEVVSGKNVVSIPVNPDSSLSGIRSETLASVRQAA